MSSIRKSKKLMKKSNGFFAIVVGNMVFCSNEWYVIKYHKGGVSFGSTEYIPYNIMSRVLMN